eukprot:7806749-Pyramimonas_sp.AAC.1
MMMGVDGGGCKRLRRVVKSKQTGVHFREADGARRSQHAPPNVKHLGVRLSVQAPCERRSLPAYRVRTLPTADWRNASSAAALACG